MEQVGGFENGRHRSTTRPCNVDTCETRRSNRSMSIPLLRATTKLGRVSRSVKKQARNGRTIAMAATSDAKSWLQEDDRRMLHVVFRVGDLEASKNFYTKCLGMKETRSRDVPEGKYTNVFYGYDGEETNFAMELTYNYGVDSYDLGTGFGHFGVATEDVFALAKKIEQNGGKIVRPPGPVKGGTRNIAFAQDPSGYKWELIEREKLGKEPFAQVMLRVGDLQKSIDYYQDVLGMKLLRTRENPEYKYSLAFMGYGEEEDNTVIELTYNWDQSEYEKGNAYGQIAISTKDVYKSAEQIKAAGGQVVREAGPVPGIGTKVLATVDPDGWKTVLVDNEDFLNELK
mmetsp:Transcript_4686/g.29542  ORF Transcript_4686/g.29542 Transcript_4686/m.29542 type:complete len:343 (-) Transcript_4686:423-1451(-)